MPIISIIVPVYNVEKYLSTCLQSIVNQSFKDFEAILVNDGSTDKSGRICEEFSKKDPRFIIIHQDNKGLPGARNSGLHIAKGEYISFVDGDDYIHPLFLETLYKGVSQTRTDICMVKSKSVTCYTPPENVNVPYAYLLTQSQTIKYMFSFSLYTLPFIVVWNKIYSRTIINNLEMNNVAAEDMDFNLRVYLRVKQVSFIDSELYYYVSRPNSIMHTNHQNLKVRVLNTYNNLLNYLSSNQSEYRGYCLEKLYKSILLARYYTINTEDWKNAKTQIKEIVKTTLKEFKGNTFIPRRKKVILLTLLHIPWLYSLFFDLMKLWAKRKNYLNK